MDSGRARSRSRCRRGCGVPAAIGAAIGAAIVGVSCGQSGDNVAELPPGVVHQVLADLADESDEVRFAAVPDLLVTEQGQVIYAAPEEVAIQGELLPDVWTNTITPAGLDAVRSAVDDGTAPVDIVELGVLVGDALGETQFYAPDRYRFAVIPIGEVDDFADPDTPLIRWPDFASISLAEVTGCRTLPELEVGEAFETAPQDAAFVDDGIVYGVLAAQDWTGAPCEVPD